MKRALVQMSTLLVVNFAGLTMPVYAAEKAQKTNKTAKKGSEQQSNEKESVGKRKTKTAYSVTPFKIEGNIIPKNYIGHDLRVAYKKLEARNNIKKEEFETTAEFNTRVEKVEKSVLYGSIKIGDKMTLVVDTESSYDADSRKLIIKIPFEISWRTKFDMGLKGQDIYKSTKEYTGSNAYGATVEITKYDFSSSVLVVKNSFKYNLNEKSNKKQIDIELNDVNVDEAIKIKKQVSALCVFTLTEPYIGIDEYYKDPTINSPTEWIVNNKLVYGNLAVILIYNKSTGDIIHRVTPKE